MNRSLAWGAVFGATGIALGALGAHALKQVLDTAQLQSFETGVRYQIFHALFLLILGILEHNNLVKRPRLLRSLVIAGVFCFSFSIYLLSMQSVWQVNLRILGPITPIGGLLLILAWVLLILNVNKSGKQNNKK